MAKNPKNTDTEKLPEDLQAIAAEYPEWADIIAGTNYEAGEPEVVDPDPNMKYYFAAKDELYPNHPGNVSACCANLQYKVSKKKAKNCPGDCVLVETLRYLYDRRKRAEQAAFGREMQSIQRNVKEGQPDIGLEALDRRGGDGLGPGVRKLPQ